MNQKAYCLKCGGEMYFGFIKTECTLCKGTEYSYEKPVITKATDEELQSGSIGSGQITGHYYPVPGFYSIASGMIVAPSVASGSFHPIQQQPSTHFCNNCGKPVSPLLAFSGRQTYACPDCGLIQ